MPRMTLSGHRILAHPAAATNPIGPSELAADTASLALIFQRWGTDKVTNGYADFYECLFRSDRRRIESALEFGIGTMISGAYSTMVFAAEGYKPGGSLRSWREFFPNAIIYGIDIQPDTQFFDEERIVTFLCDLTDQFQVDQFMRAIQHEKFDIIIDDGSHRLDDQVATFRHFFKFLGNNGTYVIEDIVYGGLFHHQDKIRAVCGDNPFFFAGPQNNPLVIRRRPQSRAGTGRASGTDASHAIAAPASAAGESSAKRVPQPFAATPIAQNEPDGSCASRTARSTEETLLNLGTIPACRRFTEGETPAVTRIRRADCAIAEL